MNILYSENLKYVAACISIITLAAATYLVDTLFFAGEPSVVAILEQVVYSLFNLYLLTNIIRLFVHKKVSPALGVLLCMLTFGLTLQFSDFFYIQNYYFTHLNDENTYLWFTTAPLGVTFFSISLGLWVLTRQIYSSRQFKMQNYFIAFAAVVIFFMDYKLFIEHFLERYGHESIFPNYFIRVSPIAFGTSAAIMGLVALIRSEYANTKLLGLGTFIFAISDFALRFKSYFRAGTFYGIGEYTYFVGAAFTFISCLSNFKVDNKQYHPSLNHIHQASLVATLLIIFFLGFEFFDDFKAIEFLLSCGSLMTVAIFVSSLLVNEQIERAYKDFSDKKYYQKHTPTEFHKIRALIHQKQKFESIAQIMTFLSHELKYPFELTNMALNTYQDTADKNDIVNKTIPGIRQGISAGMGLITTLMEMSKSERNILLKDNSLKKILFNSVVGASAINRNKNYVLNFNLAHKNNILCDEVTISSAIRNIISNSMQAIGNTHSDYIEITTKQFGNSIIFCVKNTGSFIANKDLENVFDSFFTSKKPDGNGLGLAMAKKSSEENLCKIWCTSEPETPSVSFYLKIKCSDEIDSSETKFFSTSQEFLAKVFYGKWNIDSDMVGLS